MALVLSGSVDISGSMTATTIVVSAQGAAGMVSSSAQITELVPLMAYTASLKGAAIVSSSQQIQNYNLFAVTSSANTFYGNQTISGSIGVTGDLSGSSATFKVSSNRNLAIKYDTNITISGQADSGAPENLRIYADTFKIFTSTSTAGLTERFNVGNTGNVGIETPTPDTTLHISGSDGIKIQAGGNADTPGLTIINYTNQYGWAKFSGGLQGNGKGYASISNWNGASVSETIRISGDGSVGVGTTTPGYKLDVNGDFKSGTSYLTGNTTFFSTAVNGAQNYGGSTIRLVGGQGNDAAGIQFGAVDTNTTGARGRIGFLASANNGNPKEFAIIKGVLDSTGANTCNGSLTFHTLNGDNASEASVRMTIDGSGNIGAASGTNIYNASDARLKQNITSISGSLNSVLALNPVKFNWVDDFVPSENGKDMLGFVAQEIQTIVPEAVESFGADSIFVGETEINNPLRVNEKFLIPVLTKAIQEQQAIIDGLIARIEALENN